MKILGSQIRVYTRKAFSLGGPNDNRFKDWKTWETLKEEFMFGRTFRIIQEKAWTLNPYNLVDAQTSTLGCVRFIGGILGQLKTVITITSIIGLLTLDLPVILGGISKEREKVRSKR